MNDNRNTLAIAALLRAADAAASSPETIARLWALRRHSADQQTAALARMWEHGYERVLAGDWPPAQEVTVTLRGLRGQVIARESVSVERT